MRRWAQRTHLAGLMALAAFACGPKRRSAPAAITVTDDAGRVVALEQPARRIVSLSPAATELLFALGAGDQVVGRTTWCDYPPAARAVPSVGDGLNPNVEAVAARHPDLIVLYRSPLNETAAAAFARLGVAAAMVQQDRLEDLARAARLLGRLTGRDHVGDSLAAALTALVAETASPPPALRVRVAFVVWDSPPVVIGGGSYLDELARRAGATNVFHDIATASATVAIETIAARDPDAIAVVRDSSGASPGPPEFARRREWRVIPAVRAGRFLYLTGSLFGRPSPRAPLAARSARRGRAQALACRRGRERGRGRGRGRNRPVKWLWLGLAAGAALLAAVVLGPAHVPLAELTRSDIVRSLRLPRAILAFLVGGSLAVAGAGLQALVRNPLADPFLLGLSGGAGLGAVAAIALHLASPWALPLAAFAGALGTMALVYRLGLVGGAELDPRVLILAGVAVGAFAAAVMTAIASLSDAAQLRNAFLWLWGGLSVASWDTVLVFCVYAPAPLLLLFAAARPLDLLALGEEPARYLGADVAALKRRVYVAASLLTAAAVAVSGVIGFVGLVVPHAMRLLWGHRHRPLLPAAFLGGGALLAVSDTVARVAVAPRELPVGIVTALLGVPVFVLLLRRWTVT